MHVAAGAVLVKEVQIMNNLLRRPVVVKRLMQASEALEADIHYKENNISGGW